MCSDFDIDRKAIPCALTENVKLSRRSNSRLLKISLVYFQVSIRGFEFWKNGHWIFFHENECTENFGI